MKHFEGLNMIQTANYANQVLSSMKQTCSPNFSGENIGLWAKLTTKPTLHTGNAYHTLYDQNN